LLLQGTEVFFVKSAGANNPPANAPPGGSILAEVACEFNATQTCNYDEPSFKSYLLRWMALTTQLVPGTGGRVMPLLAASALAASGQCTGNVSNPVTSQPLTNMCGRRWYQNTWDGMYGVGEQMSALSVFQNNLIASSGPPLTANTGGNSTSNPTGGTQGDSTQLNADPIYTKLITSGDKAGAGILTAIALILVVVGTYWMIV